MLCDFRTHNGGHYLNGGFGIAPSEICGYCGEALEGDRCKAVLKSDKQSNAKISGFSCPCFYSNHNYKSPLSLFGQERHTQAHKVVLAIHMKRSSVVAKFKSQRARWAAAVELKTTSGARAAATAVKGYRIFSASDLDAGSGFFAAATPVSQGEVEGGADTPMEGGGGKRRME